MNYADMSIDDMNTSSQDSLISNLGIQYTLATATRVEAIMPVDIRTRQPFGILHGGASLALAETLAGAGSYLNLTDDKVALGMQISANHVSPAMDGETVKGVATPLHLGRTSHVWNVDVVGMDGRLISSIRVVNAIRDKKNN